MTFLVDNSVWQRIGKPGVAPALADLIRDSSIVTATPQILEYGHSARNSRDYDDAMSMIAEFETLGLDDESHRLALGIQHDLWHDGKVRGASAFDILLAAIACRHGATILHYDRNFATIAAVTPSFRHRWIAEPGTID